MINIKSIWESQNPKSEIIIRTRVEEIIHLNCFAATNQITGQYLYIMSVSRNAVIPELNNYRFKGVEIFTVEVGNHRELNIYLLDNDLKDIFFLFIQNILEDIQGVVTEDEAIIVTINIVSKWKRLFDKINFEGLSLERQKGLIGELFFLNYLLINEKTASRAVQSWTSIEREYQAKDFTLASVGIEIKFTSSKQPRIKVSHERQLDTENFKKLFLVLYSAEAVKDNGVSLSSLIEQVRKTIASDEDRNLFNVKLRLSGYFDEDREQYGRMYSLKKTFAFAVTNSFPRIVKSDLPLGVYDASYSIEISAVENFIIELEQVLINI